jgi:hypothetical protein
MVFAVLIICLLVALFGPSLWAKSVLKKFGAQRASQGSVGQAFAREMLDGLGLQNVLVESTDHGDHYDPDAKAVRLTRDHFDGNSLSAIVVAAHEVGHAHQDKHAYPPLRSRTALVKQTSWILRVGPMLFMASPLLVLVFKTPAAALLGVVAGIATLGVGVIIHLVTLPTEFDASFNRALPILEGAGFVDPSEIGPARRILLACALTYVAAALMDLVNIARWLRYLR